MTTGYKVGKLFFKVKMVLAHEAFKFRTFNLRMIDKC